METSRLKLGELSETLMETILSQATTQSTQRDMTAQPYMYPQKRFNDKSCRLCEKDFTPISPANHFCSDRCKSLHVFDKNIKDGYGIGALEWLEIYTKQNGVCAICGSKGFVMNKDRHKRLLVIDHCHDTGKVRGLLCHQCNQGIGMFKENLEFLKNAVKHVEGATTISKESTLKRVEAPSSS
jgi:hypothetical protein